MNQDLFFDNLFQFLANPTSATSVLWFGLKLLYLLGFGMYVLFALVVIRQVYMMTNTYKTGAEVLLRTIALLHFFAALGVLLVAFLVL